MSPSSPHVINKILLEERAQTFKKVIDQYLAEQTVPNKGATRELEKIMIAFYNRKRYRRYLSEYYRQGFAFWALENMGRERIVYCLEAAFPRYRDLHGPTSDLVSKIVQHTEGYLVTDIWDILLFFGCHVAEDISSLEFLYKALCAVAKAHSLSPHGPTRASIHEVYLEAVEQRRRRFLTPPDFYSGVGILDDYPESAFSTKDIQNTYLALEAKYEIVNRMAVGDEVLRSGTSENNGKAEVNKITTVAERKTHMRPNLHPETMEMNSLDPGLSMNVSPHPILRDSSNFATTCNRLFFDPDALDHFGEIVRALETLKDKARLNDIVIDKVLSDQETENAGSISCLTMKSLLEGQSPHCMREPPRRHLNRLKEKRFLVLPILTGQNHWAGYSFDSHMGVLRWYDTTTGSGDPYRHEAIFGFLSWLYQGHSRAQGEAAARYADAADDAHTKSDRVLSWKETRKTNSIDLQIAEVCK